MQALPIIEEEIPSPGFDFFPGPPFWRSLQITIGSVYLTGLILMALFLWVFASVISSAPTDVLKRKLTVSAWVGLPAALIYTLALAVPNSFHQTMVIDVSPLLLWTDVFAALLIGGVLRRLFFTGWPSPDPLSLPLATFIWVFVELSGYIFRLRGRQTRALCRDFALRHGCRFGMPNGWQEQLSEGGDCGMHIASLVFELNRPWAAFSGVQMRA